VIKYEPSGAPAVVRNPKGGTATEGGTFTLRVEAGGKDPFFYQWQRDGVDIPGAVGQTYTAGPLGLADDGATYRAIVSNEVGSAFSRTATVRVVPVGTPGGGGPTAATTTAAAGPAAGGATAAGPTTAAATPPARSRTGRPPRPRARST
jgi:hypothetical protein